MDVATWPAPVGSFVTVVMAAPAAPAVASASIAAPANAASQRLLVLGMTAALLSLTACLAN
jgi:hypothetical protein